MTIESKQKAKEKKKKKKDKKDKALLDSQVESQG
jgi:hypothetical protein